MPTNKSIVLLSAAIVVAGATFWGYQAYAKHEAAQRQIADQKMIQSIEAFSAKTKISFLSLPEAYSLYSQKKAVFIDARPDRDFQYYHIKNAISGPYDTAKYNPQLVAMDKNQIVVAYCSSEKCPMAEILATTLREMGFQRVFVFSGGMKEWGQAGYPVQRAEILE